MKKIEQFISSIQKYPVLWMEIKKDSEYRKIQEVLEELWKITGWDNKNPNVIADAKLANWQLQVLLNMKAKGHKVKKEVIVNAIDDFELKLISAFEKIRDVCKKHQKLNEFFKTEFKVKNSDFKSELSKLKFDLYGK